MQDTDKVFTDKQKLEIKDFQGGLSHELFNHTIIQHYIRRSWTENEFFCGYNVFGYLGSEVRTFGMDKKVEAIFLKKKFELRSIAEFLISKEGRCFADAFTIQSVEEVMKHLKPY